MRTHAQDAVRPKRRSRSRDRSLLLVLSWVATLLLARSGAAQPEAPGLFPVPASLEVRVARARTPLPPDALAAERDRLLADRSSALEAVAPDPAAPRHALPDPLVAARRHALLDRMEGGESAVDAALELALLERGSLLALADGPCLFALDPDTLERFSAAEALLASPSLLGRLRADLPASADPAAAARSAADPELRSALLRLAESFTADAPVAAETRPATHPGAPCGLDAPLRLAGLLLAPSGDWLDAEAWMRTLVSERPLPTPVLARVVVHRYLATDWRTLALLLELEAVGPRADTQLAAALEVLALGAARRHAGLDDVFLEFSDDDPAWVRWAAAERERLRGRLVEASSRLERLVADEPFFVAAHLSLSATRVARGQASDAHTTLAFLRQGWAGTRAYGWWIDQLGRRLP